MVAGDDTELEDRQFPEEFFVQNEINEFGKDKFKFEIVIFCYTKGQMNYAVEHMHHLNNVLTAKLPNGERAFFNECIGNNRWRNIKFTDGFIQQL